WFKDIGHQLQLIKGIRPRRVSQRTADRGSIRVQPFRLIDAVELFVPRQACAWDVQQRVLLAWVDRHSVFAGHRRIYELEQDFVADTFNVSVSPDFEWK